jgi:hypothetical protein
MKIELAFDRNANGLVGHIPLSALAFQPAPSP